MNDDAIRHGISRRTTVLAAICAVICIAVILYLTHSRDDWTAVPVGRDSPILGHYPSLETCSKAVETTGGFCGRNCKEYDFGPTQCDPNIKIEMKK
jgi:hypothetical protein